MIAAQNISKYFSTAPALEDISFHIEKGEIVGFLGPNGAGKTTLMRILASYLPPTKGKASLAGFDTLKQSLAVRRLIGYLPETPPLYPDMTVKDYLLFAAKLKDVGHGRLKARLQQTLSECQLADVQHQTIATLSKGYRQRVGIAQAIIHDPQVLILDEPTSGLDPRQIIQIRQLIKNAERQRTVILSTHILSEIEQVAQRVIIIKKGKIVADQPLAHLLKGNGETKKILLIFCGAPATAEEALRQTSGLCRILSQSSSENVHTLTIEVQAGCDKSRFTESLLQSGNQLLEMREINPSLEEIFLQLTADKD